MMEDHTVKKDASLKILLLVLLVTLIGLVGFGLWSSLRPITIYKNYQIELTPGQSFKVGDDIPYIASGNKLIDISGVVNRRISCQSNNDKTSTRTIINIEMTPTNSVPGVYRLKNKIPTGSALAYPIDLPATCYIFNQVSFKPNPLHSDITYTAISRHNGQISTFMLNK